MGEFVSILLPVRNEAKYIEGCLQSIAAQDYPHDQMEILVIDGRSTDATVDSIAEFKRQNAKFKIEVLDNPDRTVPYAMNLGIANAKGDIILRFDGHSIMDPDYVTNCVKYLEQTKADNVGGPAINISNGTAIGDAILLSHNSAFGLGGGAFRMGNFEGYTDTVTFGCFPKETFTEYGLYDTRLTRNQDIELNSRIRKGIRLNSEFRIQNSETEKESNLSAPVALCEEESQNSDSSICGAGPPAQNDATNGKTVNTHAEKLKTKNCKLSPGRIYLTPKIKSYYNCRNTLRGLWDQNFKNGQWVVYTKYIAPYALSLRHFVPLIFVATILFLVIASLISGTGLNIYNLSNPFVGKARNIFSGQAVSNRFGLIALLLLAVELGAYLGAMTLAVIQAGRSQFTVDSSAFKVEGKKRTENNETVNSKPELGSLLLLPLVFVTLHLSYGLGSLWGITSLPYWAVKKQKR